VKTRDYLGHFTDELEESGSGSFIQEFVSGGPKNYAFSVFSPSTGKHTTKCKVKGIYNLELKKFKGCKLYYFEGYDPERHNPGACIQSQENQKKTRWCRI